MKKIDLFENEKLISESENKQLILTTKRIRFFHGRSKRSNFTSISLSKISAIKVTSTSKYNYLVATVILSIAGLALINRFPEIKWILVLAGIAFFLFILSIKHAIIIKSDCGESIEFNIKGYKYDSILSLVNQIEKAALEAK